MINFETVVLFPWKSNNFADISGGFPTLNLFTLSMFLMVVATIPELIIQSLFVVRNGWDFLTFLSLASAGINFIIQIISKGFILSKTVEVEELPPENDIYNGDLIRKKIRTDIESESPNPTSESISHSICNPISGHYNRDVFYTQTKDSIDPDEYELMIIYTT